MRRFIYLDTDTLNSYIAQIYDGLVQTQETETQSSQATDKQSEYTSDLGADADLKVFGKGIEGKMDFTYRHLKETSNTELISDVQTKLLHDNAFDQLMNYLNKNEHLSNHNIGDFIEINDEFYIMETNYPAFTVPRGFKCRNNREINDTHTNLTTSIYCSKPSSITSPVESKRTELRALR